MKVAITFEVDTDARLAIERLYDSKSGKPASYDRVRGWMVATLRSTLEEVEADDRRRLETAAAQSKTPLAAWCRSALLGLAATSGART